MVAGDKNPNQANLGNKFRQFIGSQNQGKDR